MQLSYIMFIFTAQCYVSVVYAMALCLCLSACLPAYLPVTVKSCCSTKTAKRSSHKQCCLVTLVS